MTRPSLRSLLFAGRTLLAAALPLLAVSAPAQDINTVAGGGPDTGLATQRPIGWPYQVALDGAGNRYVATGPLHMVVKVDASGVLSVVAGTGADDSSGDGGLATNASLRNPSGVAVDTTTGDIYISDSSFSVHKIRKVAAATGFISTVAGAGFAGYGGDGGPASLAVLDTPNHLAYSAGFLYIADSNNHRIRRIDLSTGDISLVAGDGTPGFANGSAATARFNSPNGVAVNGGGNVFVADTNNHRLRGVSGGTVTTVAGAGGAGFGPDGVAATSSLLNRPEGVAVNGAGTLFIADEANNRIRIVTGGVINTVAGSSSTPGFSGDTGLATSATMNRPFSVAVDGSGNLHIADTFNSRLRVVVGGNIDTVGGNGTIGFGGDLGLAGGATLHEQRHVALDPAGNLYIAEERNHRIRRVDAGTGVITTVAGTGTLGYNGDGIAATAAHLRQPHGVAVDGSGNVYIADTFNHRVRKVDSGGFITTVAGTGTAGYDGDGSPATARQLNQPHALAVDAAGNLYIADYGNNRIRKVTPGGTISTVAGTGAFGYNGDGAPATSFTVSSPSGLAVDATDNLFIADYGNYRIRKLTPGGTISTVAGSGPPGSFAGDGGLATAAKLNFPRGVAVDAAGNILIADTSNHRVRMVEARTGRIITVAGNGAAGFGGDGGPATAAKLNQPYSVAVNGLGRVFVSDLLNSRIRAMTLGTDLEITKTGPATAVPGIPMGVTYTVRVTNLSTINTVTSVNVIDAPPATLTINSYGPAVGGYNSGTGDWTGLSLNPGASADMTITATISSFATGTLTNTVTVAPPLGLTDLVAPNDGAQDTDLTPEADVSITKTAPGSTIVGDPLTYTLTVVNSGPSDATNVEVTDYLPPGVTFQTATAPCVYTGLVRCSLGTIPAGSPPLALTITVVPEQQGTLLNIASVTHGERDPNRSNDAYSATTDVTGVRDTVRYLTVTSKDRRNILEWLNPPGFGNVRIAFNSGPSTCAFPTATGGPVLVDVTGTMGEPGRYTHDTPPLTNGDRYCYTVWVDKGVDGFSAGKSIKGRPFPVSVGAGAKWGYNMGIWSMVPPGNGVGAVYAVANDGSLHSMVKGDPPGDEGGTWPAQPSFPVNWKPQSMNGPSQGRPSSGPVATDGSARTIFLSSQDGHVYAFNAETGALAWSSPSLAPVPRLVAHPSGVFSVFGGTQDLIFVGTRDPAGSKFYALNLADGTEAWRFDGAGAGGKIGAINGQAAVDQVAKRVYFASREFDAANNKTLWCVDFETRAACSAPWAPQALGNIDTGVSVYNDLIFVGTHDGTNGWVKAIKTSDGSQQWAFPLPAAEGAVKGYVAVDRSTGNSYFSTATKVWSLDSTGSLPPTWICPSLLSPSTPVYAPGDPYVYVGSGDGKLYLVDAASGSSVATGPFPLQLGDGSAAVGSPTLDLRASFLYVGAEDGIVYAVQLP